MNNIDKWCAEQCGITWSDGDTSYGIPQPYWYNKKTGIKTLGEWTIQDPRCREIVRERFKIDTTFTTNNDWYCFVELDKDDYLVEERGKTIAEAEIACITAIYESQLKRVDCEGVGDNNGFFEIGGER